MPEAESLGGTWTFPLGKVDRVRSQTRSDPAHKPSVLVLTQYFPPETGAAQLRLATLVRRLTALGYAVTVVTGMPNYPTGRIFPAYRGRLYRREVWEGVPVYRTWLVASVGAGIRRVLNQLSFVVTCLPSLVRAGRADVILVESPPLLLPVTAVFVGKWRRSFVVVNIADLWLDTVAGLGYLRPRQLFRPLAAIESWIYRHAGAATAVTVGLRKRLLKKGVAPAKLLFLPNGADLDAFSPREPDLQLAQELRLNRKNVVLYAGTHGYIHGLEVVLEAARLIDRVDVQFVLVGDGSEKLRLQGLAAEMQLVNVSFLDPVPPNQVARLLSFSVAGLVTVRNGEFAEYVRSAKVLPKMAAGLPVIYSGSGEGALLVEQAKAGIVVPGEDPAALATAVRQLCDHPDLAKQFGANGRAFAEQHADWNRLIDDWLEQLHILLEDEELRSRPRGRE